MTNGSLGRARRKASTSPRSAVTALHTPAPASRKPATEVHVLPILRNARLTDVPAIASLINGFASTQQMLPKSAEAIALAIDDFVVATDSHGRLLGCGALREYSPSLAA